MSNVGFQDELPSGMACTVGAQLHLHPLFSPHRFLRGKMFISREGITYAANSEVYPFPMEENTTANRSRYYIYLCMSL